ncbi:MAG: hypothetical protein HFG80_13505 [Eubacterium sp.]|nr:hypothetical protein [Eubacterium sp.]
MAKLYEFREAIRAFCGKYELYVKIVIRFALAMAAYFMINYNLGYMDRLNNMAILVVLAIISALLPVNVTVFISAVLVLLHLYALHLEVFAVGAVLFLVILLLYFRFAPAYGFFSLLTPMSFGVGIPYLMPVSSGLLGSPSAFISVVGGTVVYYFLSGVKASAGLISTNSKGGSEVDVLELTLGQIFSNREMFIVLIIFLATAVIVYLLRRSSQDHAWLVAIAAGFIFNLISLLVVYVVFEHLAMIVPLIIGEVISTLIALGIQFMVFSLDYSRVERVQFEDDEYYYYVKAVPKLYVPTEQKKVKEFHKADSGSEEE